MDWNVPTDLAIWLGLAILLGVVEIATVGFFFVFFAVGALVAALATLFTDSMIMQSLVFVLASCLLVLFARPFFQKMLKLGDKPKPSNVSALIGAEVLVLEDVDKYQGKVKVVHTGEVWSAFLADAGAAVLAVGSAGRIVKIDGAKLAVQAKPL